MKKDPPVPRPHLTVIKCSCGLEFAKEVYIIGDHSICPSCLQVHTHKFCSNCHEFYKGDYGKKIDKMVKEYEKTKSKK